MILLLDDYHLGDPLFVTGLARDLATRGEGAILIHGSAERGERALESLGIVPTRSNGVWSVESDEQAAAVERATREFNREIAHEINEAGVASVRAMAADRGLVKQETKGSVVASQQRWIRDLVDQGVVVVVAALVEFGGRALREADPAAVAAALAVALDQPVSVLLRGGGQAEEPAISLAASRERFGDPEAVGRLLALGADLRAMNRGTLSGQGQDKDIHKVGLQVLR